MCSEPTTVESPPHPERKVCAHAPRCHRQSVQHWKAYLHPGQEGPSPSKVLATAPETSATAAAALASPLDVPAPAPRRAAAPVVSSTPPPARPSAAPPALPTTPPPVLPSAAPPAVPVPPASAPVSEPEPALAPAPPAEEAAAGPALQQATDATTLPPGWVAQLDSLTGHKFYANTATGQVQWVAPQVQTRSSLLPSTTEMPQLLAAGLLLRV